jgi:urocanate hydratase
LAFTGNIVDLWEALEKSDINVDLGSDQTSLHNPFGGGYYPVGQSLEDSRMMLVADPSAFKDKVQSSLRRHVEAINSLADQGMNFWDYGNAFLLEASRAGAPIQKEDKDFIYPSYVEDIMGPLCFDHGFGPFRWVCTSGKAADLSVSDALASRILGEQAASAPAETRQQLLDNKLWIEQAEANEMVVGSQARILYADASGRIAIASAFNDAIAEGKISAPIVLGRDHHDVSGTDSPYRETANIKDGSNRCADMAVHNVIGDAFRGASWVSLHNGGGVGWGEVINGGFGLLLDGSEAAQRRLSEMLHWDVNNGVARRAWAGNEGARFSIERAMEMEPRLKITLAEKADPELLSRTID